MAKTKKTRKDPNPSEAYNHLQRRWPRSLGSVHNHDQAEIPSTTYCELEKTVPESAMRRDVEFKYNEKTGDFTKSLTGQPASLIDHARNNIASGKFRTVTSGPRQRYEYEECERAEKENKSKHMNYGSPTVAMAPSPLGGRMGRRKKY